MRETDPAPVEGGLLYNESYTGINFCPDCWWVFFSFRVYWRRGMNWESCTDMPTP